VTATSSTPKFRGAPVDFVIDVRSKLEFWMGHLPGAVCVPVDRIPDGLGVVNGLSPKSRVMVYCASGARSRAAAETLRAAGFKHVIDGGRIGTAREQYTP
jgi:rhodanese-related sulfurtransferase